MTTPNPNNPTAPTDGAENEDLGDPSRGAGVAASGSADPAVAAGGAEDEVLREVARELADVAVALRAGSFHVSAAFGDRAVLGGVCRAPGVGLRAWRGLLRAVTHRQGLGFAPGGGVIGTVLAKLGSTTGVRSLAVGVLAVSLRLRIIAVSLSHTEFTDDPLLRRLVDAVGGDRSLDSVSSTYRLVRERGGSGALSAIAPIFGELLALRALLDANPLNDTTAWLIATGRRTASADPITGVSNKLVAVLDVGEGAAIRAGPATGLAPTGSLLGFLRNIKLIGPSGRVLIQSLRGPDGITRHVVQAPGMKVGKPDVDSPQDLLGAFSSTLMDSAPYSRALMRAIDDYGIPPEAEVALIGHSAGGGAIMNLAQNKDFSARYRVTHAIAVGSPVDFKRPADPGTWVASITNQHDIIPSLDGQGAGTVFGLHPGWYVVDYTDVGHVFPLCHSIEHYLANLESDLPEARAHIEAQLAPYMGPVTRSQVYKLLDRPTHSFPRPPSFLRRRSSRTLQ
jgi:hypothetical protein